MLMIGDQVYADDVGPATRQFIRARRDLSEPPGDQVADFAEYCFLYREAWTEASMRWLVAPWPLWPGWPGQSCGGGSPAVPGSTTCSACLSSRGGERGSASSALREAGAGLRVCKPWGIS